ncbi:hypothetical protein NHQ30_000425 [Ciborinia camelliae]|nr:hypothetical protein NHQ30_000425 [Ciborinia camelliae]
MQVSLSSLTTKYRNAFKKSKARYRKPLLLQIPDSDIHKYCHITEVKDSLSLRYGMLEQVVSLLSHENLTVLKQKTRRKLSKVRVITMDHTSEPPSYNEAMDATLQDSAAATTFEPLVPEQQSGEDPDSSGEAGFPHGRPYSKAYPNHCKGSVTLRSRVHQSPWRAELSNLKLTAQHSPLGDAAFNKRLNHHIGVALQHNQEGRNTRKGLTGP